MSERKKAMEDSQTVFGNVSSASTNYGMDKFSTPRGHGFAAERANHQHDILTGKDAVLVGDDNVKNGADRIVNGVEIQSKYCKTGSKCIAECFKNNEFRYFDSNGNPMQIEVPSDKYDDAVRAMEERIKRGEVAGVSNPEEAKNIVKKGSYTYEQAKNIAKAGNIDSVKFDATNGAIIGLSAFGLSACITFAINTLNGDDFETVLEKATYSGLKVGGTAFATAVLSAQLSRTGLNSVLIGSTDKIVNLMGPKASSMLVNALRSGKNIYGAAAMKSASKLLRGNIITGGITVAVLSVGDVFDIFNGKISGPQLFKNFAKTTASVAGGTAGWVGGAAAGAAIGSAVPIVGTAIGGLIGGLFGSVVGGTAANEASKVILDCIIEDDANEMIEIIKERFGKLAEDYLINEKEAKEITDILEKKLDLDILKEMYQKEYYVDRKEYADDLLNPIFERVTKKRAKIKTPSARDFIVSLRIILEGFEE